MKDMTVETNTDSRLGIVANTAGLCHAVGACASIIKGRVPIEALRCVKLEAEDNALSVRSSSLAAHLRLTNRLVQVESAGSVMVNAEDLSAILRTISNDTVKICTEGTIGDEQLCIRTDDGKFTMYTLADKDLPPFPEPDGETATFIAADLLKMIERSIPALASADSRFAFSGALFDFRADETRIVTSESHFMPISTSPVKIGKEIKAIVPGDTLRQLAKLLANGESKEEIETHVNDHGISFAGESWELRSNLIDGEFPDYDHWTPRPADSTGSLITGRQSLIDAIEQVAVFADTMFPKIKFEFSEKRATRISTSSASRGAGELSYAGRFIGKAITIGFDPRYLLPLLRAAECDEITMWFTDAGRSVRIDFPGEFVGVVLPVDLR